VNAPLNSKLSVYLVEDSIRIRDLLIEFVTENDIGRVVGSTDTEEDAVPDILRLKPDAVVLDIRLRIGNGLNVLRQLDSVLTDSMPAVIVFTDFAIADFRRYSTYHHARYFLDKNSGVKPLGTLLRSLANFPRTYA
jgi:DNA-binding NarL/FixJ family response regulator